MQSNLLLLAVSEQVLDGELEFASITRIIAARDLRKSSQAIDPSLAATPVLRYIQGLWYWIRVGFALGGVNTIEVIYSGRTFDGRLIGDPPVTIPDAVRTHSLAYSDHPPADHGGRLRLLMTQKSCSSLPRLQMD